MALVLNPFSITRFRIRLMGFRIRRVACLIESTEFRPKMRASGVRPGGFCIRAGLASGVSHQKAEVAYNKADSDRGFYKALKEFRQVEAQAPIRIEAAPDLPIEDQPDSRMGSFCEATPPSDRERALAFLDAPMAENPPVRGSDGKPLSITRPLPPPV